MAAPDSLTDVDLEQFERLTRQESFTLEGQAAKMELVERLIEERIRACAESLQQRLRGESVNAEDAERQAREMTQQVHIRRQRVDAVRHNLIVGRGDGSSANLRVMVPAHVDTVFPADVPLPRQRPPGWEQDIIARTRMLQFTRDPHDRDRIRGLGVWDMGASVLNGVALAAETDIPKGMHVDYVFTVDEEVGSLGALKLIKEWPGWPKVDIVLSSEIGPLATRPPEGDTAMRYAVARRGRAKFLGTYSIDNDRMGHGAVDDQSNAVQAFVHAMFHLERRFYGSDGAPPIQHRHPLLGEDKFDFGFMESNDPPGLVNPQLAAYKLFIQQVPPGSPEDCGEALREFLDGYARKNSWERFGISYTLGLSGAATSYPPYTMPIRVDGSPMPHPAGDILVDAMRRVTGQMPMPTGARSVSDETLYATDMLRRMGRKGFDGTRRGVLNPLIEGNKAHNVGEWVSERSMLQMRALMAHLFTDAAGFRRLV